MSAYRFFKLILLLGIAALTACAVGPRLDEIDGGPIAPPEGKARIYFYRPIDAFLIARETEFVVNDMRVGKAISGAVFYRDALPGKYRIHTADDDSSVVNLELHAGDIGFVRAQSNSGGLRFVISAVLVDPGTGELEARHLVMTDGREPNADPDPGPSLSQFPGREGGGDR